MDHRVREGSSFSRQKTRFGRLRISVVFQLFADAVEQSGVPDGGGVNCGSDGIGGGDECEGAARSAGGCVEKLAGE